MKNYMSPWRKAAGAATLMTLVTVSSSLAQTPTQPAVSMRESIVTTVNDKIITTYDVRQRVIWLVMTLGAQPTEQVLQQLEREALQSLIEERLQEKELERQQVLRELEPGALFISEEMIDAAIGRLAQDNGLTPEAFLRELTMRGLSERTVRNQIRVQYSWQRWTFNYYGQLVRISSDRIDAQMRDIAESANQSRYLVSEIFLSNENAGGAAAALQTGNQILNQLRQQGRFEPLARQYSALPTAARGGDAGWMTPGEIRPEVYTVLEQLRPGQVSPPIPTNDGVYIVLLRERQEGGGSVQVSLKQVFVPVSSSADAATVQAAQTRLESLRPGISGCTNLEPAVATAGLQSSDLGQTNITDLLPVFQTAVNALQPGQVSAPLRSENALHLLVLCDRSQAGGAETPTREEVENRLFEEEISMIQRRELRNLMSTAVISQRGR